MLGLICMPLILLSGCIEYGTGKSYGYVTTQEDGILWDKAWFRADLASSNTDCYVVGEDTLLKEQLNKFAEEKQRAVITFNKHLWTWGCSNDEIINIETIDEGS